MKRGNTEWARAGTKKDTAQELTHREIIDEAPITISDICVPFMHRYPPECFGKAHKADKENTDTSHYWRT